MLLLQDERVLSGTVSEASPRYLRVESSLLLLEECVCYDQSILLAELY